LPVTESMTELTESGPPPGARGPAAPGPGGLSRSG
jgi:hypothetical protein